MFLPGSRFLPCAAIAAGLAASPATALRQTPTAGIARVAPNDNRVPAGTMAHDTLTLRLLVQRAEWFPEGDAGPGVTVEAFGEAGRMPSIPAPLIRVPEGTAIRATVVNHLPDSTAYIVGLGTHPMPRADTIALHPGDSVTVTFLAGAAGTYVYHARIGADPEDRLAERETTAGAFVVDPPGAVEPDRIFVINIFGSDGSGRYRNALAINGRSWPHTERLAATVGDTLRWRIVNGSVRAHPMHLHGFYFQVRASGTGYQSRPVPVERRPLEVTDQIPAWSTREIVWSPDRPGNWLFHCHLTFHVIPGSGRLDPSTAAHDDHSGDAMKHMAGLVLGVAVAPRTGVSYARAGKPRVLDLYFNQGPKLGRIPATYSYILGAGGRAPKPDSVQLVGSPLILTRGAPTDIVVHNQAMEGTSIHWHGIELESWSDGVAGWSGEGKTMAPPVVPGGRFTARLTLPRAGTFMYHTHLNDVAQVTGGAVGAIIVLEPGERYDPTHDHAYVGHWNGVPDGPNVPVSLMVNGDSVGAAPLQMAIGSHHRFRFVNIGPANNVRFEIRRDTSLVTWRARAKDGADLPPALRTERPGVQRLAVGETYDFDFTPPAAGEYILAARINTGPIQWQQRLVVR